MGFFNMFNKDSNEYSYSNNNEQIQYSNLLSKYNYEVQQKKFFQDEYKKLEKAVESLCKNILSNRYNLAQLSDVTKNSFNNILNNDIYSLIDFTKNDYNQQQWEYIQNVKELSKQVESEQQIINVLKEECERMSLLDDSSSTQDFNSELEEPTSGTNTQSIMSEFDMTSKPQKNILDDANIDSNAKKETDNDRYSNNKNNEHFGFAKPMVYDRNKQQSRENNQQSKYQKTNSNNTTQTHNTQNNTNNSQNFRNIKEDSQKVQQNFSTNNTVSSQIGQVSDFLSDDNTITTDLNTVISCLDTFKFDIINVIGTTGAERVNNITQEYNKLNKGKATDSKVRTALKTLIGLNLLKTTQIRFSSINFDVFYLNANGRAIFEQTYNSKPVESILYKLQRDHDNLIHAYAIKDVRETLLNPKMLNCKHASMNRSEISVKLAQNKTYIPDIVATTVEGEKMFIEVELGNTSQDDFNKKCNKMFEVTQNFYFVTDVQKNVDWLLSSIDKWICLDRHGPSNVSGLMIKVATVTSLKRNEWIYEKIY